MSEIIPPGSTIGMFGSGQLGRMFAMAARRLGYRLHVFSPDRDSPAGQLSDHEIVADYHDLDAVRRLAGDVDVMTYEFENIPVNTIRTAMELKPVRPGIDALSTAQNRVREKSFMQDNGFPVTPFHPVKSLDDLKEGIRILGLPAVLKTASWGYDGKGQLKIESADDLPAAWNRMDGSESILESWVTFERELSVVAARCLHGDFTSFGVIENHHVNHILDVSLAPAEVSPQVRVRADEITRGIFEKLDVVGTMAVEYFLTDDGDLMVNEIAPRPHNSGHLTMGGCETDQFEQQLRAVCGLPLGSVRYHRSVAMTNLLGDLWKHGKPDWAAAAAIPGVSLHLYGKAQPRAGRKMGHLTALADTLQEAEELALYARETLTPGKKKPT